MTKKPTHGARSRNRKGNSMKQEHDYSGALEALQRVAIAVCGVDYRTQAAFEGDIQTIRAALTAAKWRPIESAPIDLGFKYLVTNKWGDIGTGTNEYVSDFYDIGNGEYVRTATIKDPTHWKHLDYPTQDGGDDA